MSLTDTPPAVSAEMPEPSAELTLIRVLVEAHLATCSRKKGERFLRLTAEKLADEESLSAVIPFSGASQHSGVRTARRQAAEVYRRLLPLFIARLSPR